MQEYLHEGQKVKLSKLSKSDETYEELLTKVEGEIINVREDQVEVSLLNLGKNFQEIEFVRIGILLNMCFTGDDALYKVTIEVKEIKDVSVLAVMQRSKVNRIQRRQAFRIRVEKMIKYTRSKEDAFQFKEKGIQDSAKSAQMLDISSVGLKMKVDSLKDLAVDQILALELNLSCLEEGAIKGKIVRVEEEEMNIGVEFVDLPENIKQSLMRWIFKKEDELIEKNKAELSD